MGKKGKGDRDFASVYFTNEKKKKEKKKRPNDVVLGESHTRVVSNRTRAAPSHIQLVFKKKKFGYVPGTDTFQKSRYSCFIAIVSYLLLRVFLHKY